jgi:hypothetical protein
MLFFPRSSGGRHFARFDLHQAAAPRRHGWLDRGRQRRSVVAGLPAHRRGGALRERQHGGGNEMENIELKIEGTKLILTVDLSKEIGPSSSGKNTLIASTEGNANVPGLEGVKVGLYVYKAKKP